MFAAITQFVVRFRWLIIVVWIAMVLSRWNWWPSALSRSATRAPFVVLPDLEMRRAAGAPQSRSEGGPS